MQIKQKCFKVVDLSTPIVKAISFAHKKSNISRNEWIKQAIIEKLERENIEIRDDQKEGA